MSAPVGSAPPSQGLGGDEEGVLLARGLGVRSVVFMVLAAVAPLGATAVVIPTIFALTGNAAAALYFLCAAAILCLFAVGFTLMSRYVENAGAFYAYVQAGLGKIPGAGAASLALVSYAVLLVSLFAYLGVVAAAAVQAHLGLKLDWWVLAFAAIALVAFLGYRDIEVSAKVLGVVLVVEMSVILFINVAVITQRGASGLSAIPFHPSQALKGAPGLGLMFAFLAFLGFESTAVFRSEAARPERTIPRATYAAVVLMAGLYGLTAWAMAMSAGPDRVAKVAGADPATFYSNVAKQYVGSTMMNIVQLMLVSSIFAAALTFHNVVTRYQFSLARSGLVPAALGAVHRKHRSPSRSSLTVTGVTVVILGSLTLAGLDPVTEIYTWLSGSATVGVIALMALTSLSVIVFHRRGFGDDPMWRTTIAPVLALVSLCFVLYLVINNLDLLVGGKAAAAAVLAAVVASFAIGAVVTAITKVRRPQKYQRMLS